MYTTSDWAGSCNRRFPSSNCDATDVVVVVVPVGAVPLPSAELKGVQLLLLPSSGLRRMGDSSDILLPSSTPPAPPPGGPSGTKPGTASLLPRCCVIPPVVLSVSLNRLSPLATTVAAPIPVGGAGCGCGFVFPWCIKVTINVTSSTTRKPMKVQARHLGEDHRVVIVVVVHRRRERSPPSSSSSPSSCSAAAAPPWQRSTLPGLSNSNLVERVMM